MRSSRGRQQRRTRRIPRSRDISGGRPERSDRHRLELTFPPGLESIVTAEIAERLRPDTRVRPVATRNDAVALTVTGGLGAVLRLRTITAAFLVLRFAVPRPKSLLSGEYFPDITAAIDRARSLHPDAPRTFRFDAAGRDSTVFARLADQLAAATRLRHDPQDGELLIRFRRSPAAESGWDVLVRLSPRPLATRPWRVADFPGAAGGPVAAAVARMTRPRAGDRVANLMCGSGTLLIERLLTAPVAAAVGVDRDPAAIDAANRNAAAAGLADRVRLLTADISDDDWAAHGPFDVILADPPWGTLLGDHADNEAVHLGLLRRAHRAAADRARCAVLTHEIRIMERCLAATADLWSVGEVTKVFAKGHHPRIYLLDRR